MKTREYVVAVVLDPLFGERLRGLARQCDLWTVPSPQNRTVVEELWASAKTEPDVKQVTLWSHLRLPNTQGEWLGVLRDIEIHHGEYSHTPPVSTLEVYGAEPTAEARAALSEYHYEHIESMPGGFRAARRVA